MTLDSRPDQAGRSSSSTSTRSHCRGWACPSRGYARARCLVEARLGEPERPCGDREAAEDVVADTFAQVTRRPALVNLHTTPGVGNGPLSSTSTPALAR